MTDWLHVERVLDDRTVAHACAFCDGSIPLGDSDRWSLAVRPDPGNIHVVWIHRACLLERLEPRSRSRFENPPFGDRPI
jgi:hypothetical protein